MNKQDWIDVAKHLGVAAVGLGVIVVTGLFLPGVFLLIVPPLVTGAGGYFAVNGDSQTKLKSAVGWGIIGLAAGIGFLIGK